MSKSVHQNLGLLDKQELWYFTYIADIIQLIFADSYTTVIGWYNTDTNIDSDILNLGPNLT